MEFIRRFKLNTPKIKDVFDNENGYASCTLSNIYIQTVDHIESKLCEKIIEICQENNVTDAFILDKTNIVAALKKAEAMKCTEEACPSCNGGVKSFSADYCPHCGQKLEWWGD